MFFWWSKDRLDVFFFIFFLGGGWKKKKLDAFSGNGVELVNLFVFCWWCFCFCCKKNKHLRSAHKFWSAPKKSNTTHWSLSICRDFPEKKCIPQKKMGGSIEATFFFVWPLFLVLISKTNDMATILICCELNSNRLIVYFSGTGVYKRHSKTNVDS